MGSAINSVTSPLGVKLFKGGPYSDAGIGDRQQTNLDAYKAQIAPIIEQIALNAGVVNPLNPQGQSGEFSQDPYGLSHLQQAEFNRQASEDTQGYESIIKKVKANLSARGLGGSSEMAAADAYLRSQLQAQIGSEHVQAGQQAYAGRQQALQQIAGLLGQTYGQQAQVTQGQQQQAVASHESAMQQLGSLLALGLYGGGVGPFGSNKAAAPTATPAASVGGFTGNVGPMPLSAPNIPSIYGG